MTIKAPESSPGPLTATCPRGHAADVHGRFCPECGSTLDSPAGSPDNRYGETLDGDSGRAFGVAEPVTDAPANFGLPHAVDDHMSTPPAPPGSAAARRNNSPALIVTATAAGMAMLLGLLYMTVTFTVPSLRGSAVTQATSSLQDRHLKVGEISYAPDDDVNEGDVVSQSIPAGQDARFGSAIDLVVSSGPTYHDVTVTQEVTGSTSLYFPPGNCSSGLTGYWDVSEGTSVTITGDSGETLGTGQFEATNPGNNYFCEYTATVYDIPGNHDQYTVTVGTGSRGDFTYSRDEMDQYGWDFGFTLGD